MKRYGLFVLLTNGREWDFVFCSHLFQCNSSLKCNNILRNWLDRFKQNFTSPGQNKTCTRKQNYNTRGSTVVILHKYIIQLIIWKENIIQSLIRLSADSSLSYFNYLFLRLLWHVWQPWRSILRVINFYILWFIREQIDKKKYVAKFYGFFTVKHQVQM